MFKFGTFKIYQPIIYREMGTKLELRLDEGIRKLRLETFEKGFPFMIHDDEFAEEGFIFEYPDGTMKLMKLVI